MYSYNLVDLQPVGALTAGGAKTPHSFRPWEVQSIDSIDLMDSSLGSVQYQVRGGDIMRVLPRTNDQINGEWATDKGRYAPLDGVKSQQITKPFLNIGDGVRQEITMEDAFSIIKKQKGSGRIIYGATSDIESVRAITHLSFTFDIATTSPYKPYYNRTIEEVDLDYASVRFFPAEYSSGKVLLVGCDPRIQSPFLNLKLRELYLQGIEFYNVGPCLDLTYPVHHYGLSTNSINRIRKMDNTDGYFDLVIIGADVYRRKDYATVLSQVEELIEFNNTPVRVCTTRTNESYIFNDKSSTLMMHDSYNSLYNRSHIYDMQILVNLTESEVDAAGLDIREIISSSKFNVTVTCKGSDWMKLTDLIVPVANPLQTKSTYYSMFGHYHKSEMIINKPSSLLETSKLLERLQVETSYDDQSSLIRPDVKYDKPVLNSVDYFSPFVVPIVDYHLEGHVFAESSPTMARCSAVFSSHRNNFN